MSYRLTYSRISPRMLPDLISQKLLTPAILHAVKHLSRKSCTELSLIPAPPRKTHKMIILSTPGLAILKAKLKALQDWVLPSAATRMFLLLGHEGGMELGFTTMTGQSAFCTRDVLTDPSNNLCAGFKPRDPTTNRSASITAASSSNCLSGSPTNISSEHSTPYFLHTALHFAKTLFALAFIFLLASSIGPPNVNPNCTNASVFINTSLGSSSAFLGRVSSIYSYMRPTQAHTIRSYPGLQS
mmetsp:Transcript_36870/g.59646  ORF Transcript_36870/g.59646 Transcript_36870/m.59646 type:complete len:242 (-) Transcript_36870:1143-1868(-)